MSTDLEILRADLVAAHLPHPRTRIALLVAAAAVTITAAAIAADHYLGQPAPAHVNATFQQALRYAPTASGVRLDTARVIGLSPHAILFGADASDGTYCFELATHGGTNYLVSCGETRSPEFLSVYRLQPFWGTAASPPPYVIAGRLSQHGHSLEARSPNGRVEQVQVGSHGAFLFEPKDQRTARRGELRLVERDAGGSVTNHVTVLPQIVVHTTGVPVRRIDGVTLAAKARKVEIEVWIVHRIGARREADQSGETVAVPLRNGRFSWTVTPQKTKFWQLQLNLVDGRLFPLGDPTTGIAIPDRRFYAYARAEALRVGL